MAMQLYQCCILSFILLSSLAPGKASDLVTAVVRQIDPRDSFLSAVDPNITGSNSTTTGSNSTSNGEGSIPIQMPTMQHRNGYFQPTLEFLEFWNSEESQHRKEDGSVFTDTEAISDWFECDVTDYMSNPDPNAYSEIPTDEDFSVLVEAYVYAMRKNSKEASVQRYDPTVFKVPVEVRSIPHVGRGVFAAEDIPQGTLVAKPSNSLVFSNKQEYRDFLAHLVFLDYEFICDQILWMYGMKNYDQDDESGNLYRIILDADATSLVNDEDWTQEEIDAYYYEYEEDDEEEDDDDEEETTDEEDDDEYEYEYEEEDEDEDEDTNAAEEERALEEEVEDCLSTNTTTGQLNITCGGSSSSNETVSEKPKKEKVRFANAGLNEGHDFKDGWIMYALKDIKAGEEIIMSYDSFVDPEAFEEIGLWH